MKAPLLTFLSYGRIWSDKSYFLRNMIYCSIIITVPLHIKIFFLNLTDETMRPCMNRKGQEIKEALINPGFTAKEPMQPVLFAQF